LCALWWTFPSNDGQLEALYQCLGIGERPSADLTMVALTLLRTGRVTLAETIEPEVHRTATGSLGSSLFSAFEKPMGGNSDHSGPDGYLWPRATTRKLTTSTW